MSFIINQARKGNAEAMLTLYNNNKEQVLFLCTLLLDDTNAACNATSRTFRNMWDVIIAGEVKTEGDFSQIVIEKAVNCCKSSISKKDTKAFRTPVNNNFIVKNYSAGKIFDDKERPLFLVHNLPPLQRFICVLNTLFGYDESKLAQMLKISEANVKLALQAEEANLESYLSLYKKSNGEEISYSKDEFHRELERIGEAIIVPKGLNTTVLLGIDSVCEPILKKAKKDRNKIIMYIGGALLCLCLLSLTIWGLLSVVKNAEDNYSAGYTDGYDEGYDTGYSEGYYDGYYDADGETEEVAYTTEYTATHYADIAIEGYGTIIVALEENQAPITVQNFVNLANQGFYNGLTFHRIVEGFVMQGGDPEADGTGSNKDEDGNEVTITGEFYYNGSSNMLSHVRGAISMARGDGYDSASSQFFIVQSDDYIDSLDGLYAVFGYVTEGIDIVDAICEVTYTVDEYEVIAADEQPIITSITIREVGSNAESDNNSTAALQ